MTGLSLLAASFITPGLFYAGAAAVSVPILIHLLARRRFKRIRWAAIEFLIHAERRNRRRIRLEEWILLALRCLAILLISLFIARPFLRPSGLSAGWGGSRRVEHILVLDDSFSMGFASAGDTSFERAKTATERLLESIRAESPDDTVTILRMSAVENPIESGTFLNESQNEDVLARLHGLTPSQRSVDVAAVMQGVADLLGRQSEILNAAVYIIADFQRRDWIAQEPSASSQGSAVGNAGGLPAPLVAWSKEEDHGLRFVLVNVGDAHAANRAITEVSIRAGQLVAGTAGRVRATVANYADTSDENVALQVTVGSLAQPAKTLRELAAWQTASVDLEFEFLRAGYESARVELPPDALPIDDVRYVAAEVANAIRVLIVNGEPSADHYEDEVSFLATALRPEGEVFSGNELVIVDETEIEDVNLTEFHAVIFANVYRVSEPTVDRLERFVRRGGGLIFFLGDQVDADLYNAALYRDGQGLLPAELIERSRAADETHLTVTDRLHPVMRGLSQEGDPLGIGQIAFLEHFACKPVESHTRDAGDVDPADGTPTPGAGGARAARVIARFDDVDEHPAIIEQSFGRGRVILVTTTADKEWHLWPDHPTFLPVVMELVQHVARRMDGGREQWVGSTLDMPIDPAVFDADVIVRGPAYPQEHEVGVTALPASDGRGLTASWEHTDASGLYQFVLKRHDGTEEVRLVAVNVDPRESDLSMAEERELRRAMGDVPFEYVVGIDKLVAGSGDARTELWRVFLVVALAVLMGEQCLAWRWGRHR